MAESLPNTEAADLPSLDITYAAADKRLDLQFEQVNSLDLKASFSLASGIILLGAALGASHQSTDTPLKVVVFLVGLTPLVISSALSIVGLWVKRYERPPNPLWLRDHYIVERQEITKLAIIDSVIEAIEVNHQRIRRKILFIRGAYAGLLMGAIIVAFVLGTGFVLK